MTEEPPGRAAALVDHSRAPFVTIWETTRACDLACVHCRAAAQPARDPRELATDEALRLLEDVRRFGRIVFVMTGGDPLKRPDLPELAAHAVDLGLLTAMSPSGTPLLTRDRLAPIADAGVRAVSISIDGSHPGIHDEFRGTPGSFGWCLSGARVVNDLGMDLQVNTTVSRYNRDDLPRLAELVARLEATRWSVFFLVPTGRGRREDALSATETERVLHWLYELSETAPFHIKTTEGQHYRRVALQREALQHGVSPRVAFERSRTAGGRFLPGINSGNGFLFVSHVGEIQPSGFLPLTAGNVRDDELVGTYRQDPLFRGLRDPEKLRGRCHRCLYRVICGGSRARAYAMTGDPFAEDPACAFEPAGEEALPAA